MFSSGEMSVDEVSIVVPELHLLCLHPLLVCGSKHTVFFNLCLGTHGTEKVRPQ
jgi:hypothetical protein